MRVRWVRISRWVWVGASSALRARSFQAGCVWLRGAGDAGLGSVCAGDLFDQGSGLLVLVEEGV